jgi:murein DD-endopeptidase MepM/ murein hydrolase activator NlpD
MSSPRRAALRSLLVAAVVPAVVTVGMLPAAATPSAAGPANLLGDATAVVAGVPAGSAADLASAQDTAKRLRAEVDALGTKARQAADAADRYERAYAAAAGRAAVAQRSLADARAAADALEGIGTDRVRALYMSGGELGVVNTLLRAGDLADLSSRQENVAVVVGEDAAKTSAARTAEARAAAAKAALDKVVAEQAAAAASAAAAVQGATAALATRRDLLVRADTTVKALLAAQDAAAAQAAQAALAVPVAPDARSVPVTGGWTRPAIGPMSSPFGMRWGKPHQGTDIAARPGSVIRAAASGTVVLSRWYGGYGNAVELDHGGGVHTRYGHASALLVAVGEYVTAGQPIALVGSTGDSTGPHLHFEVRLAGVAIDPVPFMLARGVDLR